MRCIHWKTEYDHLADAWVCNFCGEHIRINPTWECAGCHTTNSDWAERCGRCAKPKVVPGAMAKVVTQVGAKLVAEIGAKVVPGKLPSWTCAHCGQNNGGFALECGRCGRRPKSKFEGFLGPVHEATKADLDSWRRGYTDGRKRGREDGIDEAIRAIEEVLERLKA